MPEKRYFDLAEVDLEEIAARLWEMVQAARAGESDGDGADEEVEVLTPDHDQRDEPAATAIPPPPASR